MLHELITGLIPITLIISTLVIAGISIIKQKQSTLSKDENELIRYITAGTKLILKRFISFSLITTVGFTIFIIIINLLSSEPLAESLLIIISSIVSILTGWIGLKLSINSLKQLLHHSKKSINKLYETYQFRSQWILTVIISISIIDLSIWFLILDTLTTYNIGNLGTYCADFFGFSWSPSINSNYDYINHKHFFISIIMSGYIIGAVLQAFLARIKISIFSVSLDTTGDIIGFTEYDLPEDELKNPCSIPDQIGDQAKGTFLLISELYSIIAILTVATAIIGGKIGIIEHSFNSMALIEFPLIFIATGLFLTITTRKILTFLFKTPKNIFARKINSQIIITTLFTIIFYILNQLNLCPAHISYAALIGLVGSIILYTLTHQLFGPQSKSIQFVEKFSKNNILGTICSGLFIGFLGTVIIGGFVSLIIALGFNLSGPHMHIVTDLYHIAIIGVGLLVGSLTLFSDTLCHSISDNALGITSMLSLDKDQKTTLTTLKTICATTLSYFKILWFVILFLISGTFLLITMMKSMQWIHQLEKLGYQTKHHVTTTKSKLFDIAYEINQFILPFDIHFLNLKFIAGLLFGILFLFGICAYIMFVIAKSNHSITNLIHTELKSNPTIWDNKKFPDYINQVNTLSLSSSKVMINILIVTIILSLIIWTSTGIAGTIGFILTQIVGGLTLNSFFITSGTLWCNTKSKLETTETNLDTSHYISIFFTDKLGDLFKDALGPILTDYVKFNLLLILILLGFILEINEGIFF